MARPKGTKDTIYHSKVMAQLEYLNTLYGVGVQKATYENNNYRFRRLIIDKEGHAWFQVTVTKKGGVILHLKEDIYFAIKDKIPKLLISLKFRTQKYVKVFSKRYIIARVTENTLYTLHLIYKEYKNTDKSKWSVLDFDKNKRVLYTPKITTEEFYEINGLL